MDLSDIESFHYLYRSLWQPEDGGKRICLNIMDTIIFQHGHPFRWIFTSEKTGEVLKKKECRVTAGEIVSALKKRASKLRGKKIVHNERSRFASVWYRTEKGTMVYRLLDEAELFFILGDRTYTQFISAIQVFFGGVPLKGCGIFEHHYVHRPGSDPIHRTFEYVHRPESIDIFELNHQIEGTGGALPNGSESRRPSELPAVPEMKQERLNISETQHEILMVQSAKLMKLLEKTIRCGITKATFLYFFNTSWTPFVVACTKLQVESSDATLPMVPGEPGYEAAEAREKAAQEQAKKNLDMKDVDVEKTEIHVVKSPQKKPPPKLIRTATEIYSTAKDWQVKKEITEELKRFESFDGPPASGAPPVKTSTTPASYIPPPNSSLPRSKIDYVSNEAKMKTRLAPDGQDQQVLMSKFGGKRHSVLSNFITLNPGGTSANQPGVKKADAGQQIPAVLGRQGIQSDMSEKRFMTPTDNKCVRVRSDADVVRKSEDERWNFIRAGSSRRPISAPHTSRISKKNMGASTSSSTLNITALSSYNLPKGKHGIVEGGARASGLQRKLPLQGQACFGDYCNLLTPLAITLDDTDEYLRTVHMMKCTGSDGVVRLKSTLAEHQISCKTVLLGRAESKYIGGEVAVGENIESYEYSEEDVINACAKQHVERVAEKCRKEAFSSLIRGGLEGVPSMSNLQATAFAYRNLIYNDALTQVHPSRFYYTVPACKVCFQLYSALDKVREAVIHRPNSSGPSGRTQRLADTYDDNDDMATDIVKKARQALRERADACRSPAKDKKVGQDKPDSGRLLEWYEENGIYDDNEGTGTYGPEMDDAMDKLETCVEGEENSTISPRADSPEVRRVDKYLEMNQWEHNATRAMSETKNGEVRESEGDYFVPRLPATATANGDAYETKIRISKPITRTHSVGGRELSSEELEVERRKGELMGGSHLGGQYRGANEQVTKNVALTQGLIRKLAGSKSNGSMYTWVDLMSTAKSKQKKTTSGSDHDADNADTRSRPDSPRGEKNDALSWSARRANMTSPEVVAKRAAVIEERKVDRTQWHESLRDESMSPVPTTRKKRPSSAATAIRKSSSGSEHQKAKPPFAVRSGQDLKTISGTFISMEPGKPRPRSAGGSSSRNDTYSKTFGGEVSHHRIRPGALVEDSNSATYTASAGDYNEGGDARYIDSAERDRLEILREEILRERRSRGAQQRVHDTAQSLSRGDYSYGHVPFSDAQCLPFRGNVGGSHMTSSGLDAEESSNSLGFLNSDSYSDTHRNGPKGIPKSVPLTTKTLALQERAKAQKAN